MARKHAAAPSSGYTILVVDDQEEILISNRLLLEKEGHTILTAANGEEALTLFRPGAIPLVIVDYFMPGMSGAEVVKALRERDEEVQILLQTGYSGEKPPREMLRSLAIQGYHDKSEGPERLLMWVEVALKTHVQLQKIKEAEQTKALVIERERLKDELVSIVSHELRTPLTSLRGFAELMLKRTFAPEKQHEFLSIIHTEAVRLTNLINNFLDLQRMESGRQTYDFSSVDIVSLICDTLSVFSLGANGTHSFRLDAPESPPPVWADADRLRQVLPNFPANAVKFSPQGGEICVGARREGEQIIVWVKDQGVGIPQENHDKLFTKFYRVDNQETRHVGGTGLGLAIVREIVDVHKGRVWVESTAGVGSTFFFALPMDRDFLEKERSAHEAQLADRGGSCATHSGDLPLHSGVPSV
ncbi:MAG: sensor histidine kinase [Candidatus Binatia bacterium]